MYSNKMVVFFAESLGHSTSAGYLPRISMIYIILCFTWQPGFLLVQLPHSSCTISACVFPMHPFYFTVIIVSMAISTPAHAVLFSVTRICCPSSHCCLRKLVYPSNACPLSFWVGSTLYSSEGGRLPHKPYTPRKSYTYSWTSIKRPPSG